MGLCIKICTPVGFSCSTQNTIDSCCLKVAAVEVTWYVLVSSQGIKVSVGRLGTAGKSSCQNTHMHKGTCTPRHPGAFV